VTIITATHDPFVMEHVDRVEELSDGRLVPPAEQVLAPRPVTQPPRRPTPLR
jgi:ABC-type lipoprotein export system ATPase subunit